MHARSPEARGRWASRGLAVRATLDGTVQAMLLRQLYLSHYEAGRFARALAVVRQAIDLDVLVDVLHHDAARAALAASAVDEAVAHLRAAARLGPASRRAFHLWTLGSALFFAHRYAEAIAALEGATRWGARGRPLYRAHLALVRLASGQAVDDLQQAVDDLIAAPCRHGYGRFVLGHLAYASGAWDAARGYLAAFVRRAENGGDLRRIALDAELAMARATLAKMAAGAG
jgi:tetratricopeptide (TPR) repeat protein